MTSLTETAGKIWHSLPVVGNKKPVVTHLTLAGVIASDARTGRALNMPKLEKAIEAAFEPTNLKAVAISINSPGGSPVQSRLIHDRIRDLAREKEVPVLTFIQDVGASGGYILAIAGDEVFADASSIVGSIGVISGGFGFVDAIEKLGVERRVYTAGQNKSTLDPFRPEKAEDVKHLGSILDTLHEVFIDLVKDRRAGKLAEHPDIFSGRFWAAEKAQELGLIDGVAEIRRTLKDRFGDEVKIKKIGTEKKSLLQTLLSRDAAPLPTGLVDPQALAQTIEERSLWARYGL